MPRFRFSLRLLLLLLTLAAVLAGWVNHRMEMQRLAEREAYRQRLVSRLAWLEEDRNGLAAELNALGPRLERASFIGLEQHRQSIQGKILAIGNYIDTTNKELCGLRQ